MKIWVEEENNLQSYFGRCDEYELKNLVTFSKSLSVFSINGSEIFTNEDRIKFLEICRCEIEKKFGNYNVDDGYKLYLFVNVRIRDKNSRIEKYKKVWKSLQSRWKLDDFEKGSELEMKIGSERFFTSIAQFKIENLNTALEIVSSSSKRCTLIVSKEEIISDIKIVDIFSTAFNKYGDYEDEIDYLALANKFAVKGDIIFRWGDSCEEAEIAIIYKTNLLS